MASAARYSNTDESRQVDWGRFGLNGGDQRDGGISNTPSSVQRADSMDLSGEVHYEPGGRHPYGTNEIFAQEADSNPWWKSNFFLSQPVLFGTWDGVFTSCLINIFGVIVFLRSGWIVAQAGIINAVVIVLATVSVVLVSVLSAVGICERCRMESGGVYFLVSHVLGSKFGGSLGLLYVFGQAVGCALYVLGFGESMAHLVNLDSKWAERGFASAAVILLGVINVAGVKWVIKLQFVLLLVLLLAGLDFAVGSFVHTDTASGFDGWLSGNIWNNTFADFQDGQSWFTVFGVFFPTVTGVMAGINMSGDLRNPSLNIPNGTLAAMGTATFLYLIFVLFLGATCQRAFLLNNYMIAAKVSAVQVLLLCGLYVSSMSSCLAAMYGTPRVLQSVANENVIPIIQVLGRGRGPNKVPLYSMAVVAVITVTFILVGQINTLAPIVTMPFLLTYASIDYSYFALAQTFDIQHKREERFRIQSYRSSSDLRQQAVGYGTTEHVASEAVDRFNNDLDYLFPERTHHRRTNGSLGPGMSNTPSFDEHLSTRNENEHTESDESKNRHIHSKTNNWYSVLCNRWFSLVGAVVKLLIMFLVHWGYALANIAVVLLVFFYVGHANPAVKPGLATEFKFLHWLKMCFLKLVRKRSQEYEQIVLTPSCPEVVVNASQINEENEDFASRKRYHHSSNIQGYVAVEDDE
ncbi:solute carrier family 12 member 8 [Bacillus rossius redtenbacheri]|uniref:solute carrier family 12 member 8 n=1 Tax=Bacillus rossius redtenbacheri TaxID=93214 RepID=UPI002FDE904C